MKIFSNKAPPAARHSIACMHTKMPGCRRAAGACHLGAHPADAHHPSTHPAGMHRSDAHHPSTHRSDMHRSGMRHPSAHPAGMHPADMHRSGMRHPAGAHPVGVRRFGRQGEGGFSLIEVLLATGLSMLLVTAAYFIFSQNQVIARKNAWRFAFEDSARFALETINEKFSLAGHTMCAEIGDYDMDVADAAVAGAYTPGANLLYQVAAPNNNRLGKIQAYNGDANGVQAANNWYPALGAGLNANVLTNAINPQMDAVVVRSLGKHVYRLAPPTPSSPTAGSQLCSQFAAQTLCLFNIMVDNPLIDSTLSFDNDPMFFDVSSQASGLDLGIGANNIFPVAVTNCAAINHIRFMRYLPARQANAVIEGVNAFQYWLTLVNTNLVLPTTAANPSVFSQAANFDLIYVSDVTPANMVNDGRLFITRPGRIPNSDPAQTGLTSVPLTPPISGNRGDVIVTGFRVLYGTTTAAGLPNGFLRPDNVVAWDQVRLVRYAISFEIFNYYETQRSRAATNLLDQVVNADTSRNLRRIYEQVVFINN